MPDAMHRAMPENPSSNAPEMPRTDGRTNATNARISHPLETSSVPERVRPQRIEIELARTARILAEQDDWWQTVGAVAQLWAFESWPDAADWFATVPRLPLVGLAREVWVAEQRVKAGIPAISPERQMEIAFAALDAAEQTRIETENEHAVRVGHTNGSPDWEIALINGISAQTVFRIRHRLGLRAVSHGGKRAALGSRPRREGAA